MRPSSPNIPDRLFDFLKIFISYAHQDAAVAGALSRALQALGCEVFVAHDDIQPGTPWQDEIVVALRRADIFLPVLTEDFARSEWCEQEAGMALALRKFIVPLKIALNPGGFLARVQALRHSPDNAYGTADQILSLAAEQPRLRERALDHMTRAFKNSGSFAEANSLAAELERRGPLSVAQVEEVLAGGSFNNQVIYGTDAAPFVQRVVQAHCEIPPELVCAHENARIWRESTGRKGVPPGVYLDFLRQAAAQGKSGASLVQALKQMEQDYRPEDRTGR